jgi:hypothetical protein
MKHCLCALFLASAACAQIPIVSTAGSNIGVTSTGLSQGNALGNAGLMGVIGNTGYPTIPSNSVSFMGPNNASFTPYAFQWPGSAPTNSGVLMVEANGIVTSGGTYASGSSTCTNGTQVVTFTNGGGTGATGTVSVVGNVPTGAISLTAGGSGFTSAPTTATIATCTGTATITGTTFAHVSTVMPFGTGMYFDAGNDLIIDAVSGSNVYLYSGTQSLCGAYNEGASLAVFVCGTDASIGGDIQLANPNAAFHTTIQSRPLANNITTVPGTAGGIPVVILCGTKSGATTTCADTNVGASSIVYTGSTTLASGTSVETIAPGYSATTSYWCLGNDTTTTTNGVKIISTSATTMTFTGTGTDVIQWICVGN